MNKNLRAFVYALCAALLALAFLLIYSYYTSPLTPQDNGGDAAFFRLVGQGMTRGLLPYRDFFDMKGPYLFLIQYAGQLICYGRAGIFLLQWLNLTLALLLADRCLALMGAVWRPAVRLALLLPLLWMAAGSFEGGNLTEEFSLVPLLTCLYLCLRYLRGGGTAHRPLWALCYGVCFGFVALIRLTNTALICAVVLTICIMLIRGGLWKNLLQNAGMFLLGVASAFLPAGAYFAAHGLLADMLRTVFGFGFSYFAEKTVAQHLMETLSTGWLFLPTLFAPAAALLYRRRERRYVLLSVLCAGATVLAISSGNLYFHYFTLAIPCYVLGLYLLAGAWSPDWSRRRKGLAAALAALCLLGQATKTGWYTMAASDHLFGTSLTGADYTALGRASRDIAAHIPPEDADSVFGYNIAVQFYTYVDLFPCNKYCGWLAHYIELVPSIRDELAADFAETPPRWVIFYAEDIDSIRDFMEMTKSYRYSLEAYNDTFFLYHINA